MLESDMPFNMISATYFPTCLCCKVDKTNLSLKKWKEKRWYYFYRTHQIKISIEQSGESGESTCQGCIHASMCLNDIGL